VIVAIVILLFLGSLRSVPGPAAIPVSLIGAVFLMQIFGFTMNLLTLLAIVLSVAGGGRRHRHRRERRAPYPRRTKPLKQLLGARELVGQSSP
jgi:multidrug efflux pump